MMASAKGLPALTEKTFLPLGLFFVALVAVAGGAWWLSAMYANLTLVNTRLERIEKALADSTSISVTTHDMRMWVMTLKAQNESLKIPDWMR